MNKDKISVHKVELGFEVEEEVMRTLSAEVSPDTIKDAKEILNRLADKPSNKNALDKINAEKKLEEAVQIIITNGRISKDKLTEMIGKNTISSVGLLRNYVTKLHGKKLVKQKDDYLFEDPTAQPSPVSEPPAAAQVSQPQTP